MNINLEYYKIFYYVCKTGRITLAAKELSISQPAVSQAVKQLETLLHIQLFIRTPKGVHLTAEGKVLYSYVQRGYESIVLGEQKLQQMLNLSTGEIRIGASDMTLQFYLLPYLEQFHELYPGIKVSVTNAPTPETLGYMKEGKIDFGVVSSPIPPHPDIQIRPVKGIQDIFVAGIKFSHLRNRILDIKELEQLPIICLEPNTSTRACIDELLSRKNIVLHPEFELATSDMIVQFAIRNLGIGYVMSEFADEYIRQGILFPLQLTEEIPKRQFCIITDKNSPISTAAKTLLSLFGTFTT